MLLLCEVNMKTYEEIQQAINTMEDAERALKVARELSYTLDYIKQQMLSLTKITNDLPTLSENQPTSN